MARILVTGSDGFIGRHLVPALRNAGHVVGAMDIGFDETGEWDGIVHFAAISRVSIAERNPVLCMQANVLLTAKVLERPCKWFILASTNESANTVYVLSKRFAEEYAALICAKRGISLHILRLTNVIGAGMDSDKLAARIAAAIHEGKTPTINDGVLPFDYVRVENVVKHVTRLCDGTAKTKEGLISVVSADS